MLHLRIHEGCVDGVHLDVRPGADDMTPWPSTGWCFAASELSPLTGIEYDLAAAGGALEREEAELRAEVEGIHFGMLNG